MKRSCRPETAGLAAGDPPEGAPSEAASLFAPTLPEDVFGMLAYAGAPKSVEDMHAGIAAEARRRHADDRS
jgi:hypothetical protein